MSLRVSPLLLGALGLAAVGCGPPTAVERGAELFADPDLSESQFNDFSCATCHAATPEPDAGVLPSGHTLYDSAGRPSYWGGQVPDLLSATNHCFVFFMRSPVPLAADEPRSKALYEYLRSVSPSEVSPAKPLTIVKDVVNLPGGDEARGKVVYDGACRVCHGEAGTGAGKLERASDLPGVASTYSGDFPGVPPRLVLIEKVRHGQFFGVGGNMPLYGKELLSDEDLASLSAYLGL